MNRLQFVRMLPLPLLLSATGALAQTVINGETRSPLRTSTAGNITIEEDGSIEVDSGAAITVDSNNNVTIEDDGSILVGDANGARGISVAAGTNATILNDGLITVTEDFTVDDDNGDGIADGPIAEASGRYGIRVEPGAGSSGSITNEDDILVEGLNSGGIVLSGPYPGNIENSGDIVVIGDGSVGIGVQDLTGNLTIEGSVTVVGEGAQALRVEGDIDGVLTIQGDLAQSRTFTADSGTSLSLSRSDLRNGAAAAQIQGNISGGILIAAPPYDLDSSDSDEDDDDVTDTSEDTGTISSIGNSPALLIGGADDIRIGTVTGRDGTYSLVVDGTVSANAYYSSTDAFGIVIGGEGGTVDLPGGIGVSGSVGATISDSSATAILINSGANVPVLYNSGSISAAISQPGQGASYAIRDLSGTLTRIDNTGFISVSGSSEDLTAAIDLSSNASGVTISQYLNDQDIDNQEDERDSSDYDPDNPIVYTSITGNILTGSGNDLLDIASGEINGDSFLGAGDDQVRLSDNARYDGDISFGSGVASMTMSGTSRFNGLLDLADAPSTLTISDDAIFTGTLDGGSQLAVNVNGGGFGGNEASTLRLDRLTVSSGGALNAYIDGDTSSLVVANVATFEQGSKVSATIASLLEEDGRYTILTADTLEGTVSFGNSTVVLPVLYKGSLTVGENELILDVTRKTAAELNLNRASSQAYDAIMAAALNSDSLGGSLLEAEDLADLQGQFDQLLPDHAGGVFDVVTRGSRLAWRHIADADSLFDVSDMGGWVQPFFYRGSKDTNGTVGFRTRGWGISTGIERLTNIGNVGLSFAYNNGKVRTGDWQTVKATAYEFGGFWRGSAGPFYAYARAGLGRVSLSSDRTFSGRVDETDFSATTSASWKGWTTSGSAGASYRFDLGDNLFVRPSATVEYYRLKENGYEEDGADAIELTVGSRTSDALSATPNVVLGWSAGQPAPDWRPLTFEVEAGRRMQVAGGLGTTVAFFADGDSFSLTPDSLKSGWTGEARILQGSLDYTWKIAAGAEKTQGNVDYSARFSFSIAF